MLELISCLLAEIEAEQDADQMPVALVTLPDSHWTNLPLNGSDE
jgi:hypothetical protein